MKSSLLAPLAAVLLAGPAVASLPSNDPADHRPLPVIDMHTHVFNASDLPLGGLIGSFFPERTAKAAEDALKRNLVAEDADGLRPEQAKFFQAEPAAELPKAETLGVRLLPAEREAFADFLGVERSVSWQKNFSRQSATDFDQTLPEPLLHELPTDLDRLAEVLYRGGFLLEPEPGMEPLMMKAGLKSATLWGYARFIYLMLQSRTSITNALAADYRPGDLFVAHMMDMDRAYASHSLTPFEQQQGKMHDLTRAFGGKLVHFTAFDPFRDADALASVVAGIDAGAIGVKFYPPSGYRAARNEIPPRPTVPEAAVRRWDSRYQNRTAAGLDATMHSFFAEMVRRDLPVFTHCTNAGFEAVTGYGWNADPAYWAVVLDEFPTLRLCFGHSGGHQFWFSKPGAVDNEVPPAGDQDFQRAWGFGQQVVALCLKYPNVYCEVAYLELLLQSTGATQLSERLARELPRKSNAKPEYGTWTMADKVMYGTDWHMLYKEPGHQKYLAACDAIISKVTDGAGRRKFFAGNAVKFLQLDKLAQDARFTAAQRQYWSGIVANAK